MGETVRIVVDPDVLERVTAEVVREVPAHLVPGEVRRRLAAASRKREPNEATRERARRIAEEVRRRET